MNCERLKICAHLSVLAYKEPEDIDFLSMGYELLQVLSNKKTGTQGFIVGDCVNKVLYIVFRGTSELIDVGVDLKFQQVPVSTKCGSGYVHNGALEAFKSVSKQIFQPTFRKYSDWEIIVTGHSLGGAVAVITGAALTFPQKTSVITFGSPKVGDIEFAQAFNSCNITSIRVVHEADPVPELPPFPHYVHVRGLLRIDSDGNILKDYGFFFRLYKTISCWVTRKKVNKSLEVFDLHDHKRNAYVGSLEKLCQNSGSIFSRWFSK